MFSGTGIWRRASSLSSVDLPWGRRGREPGAHAGARAA
jgi:hypothetical protein